MSSVWAEDSVLDLVANPLLLVKHSVGRVKRVEVRLPEAEDTSHRVTIHGNLILAVRALKHEGVVETSLLCRVAYCPAEYDR
jgi:hypothetical protein